MLGWKTTTIQKKVMFKTLNNWIQWSKSLCRYFSHSKVWSPQIVSLNFEHPTGSQTEPLASWKGFKYYSFLPSLATSHLLHKAFVLFPWQCFFFFHPSCASKYCLFKNIPWWNWLKLYFININLHYSAFAFISGHKIVVVGVDVGGSLATTSSSSVRKKERENVFI